MSNTAALQATPPALVCLDTVKKRRDTPPRADTRSGYGPAGATHASIQDPLAPLILARWSQRLPWSLEVAHYKQIATTRRRVPRERVAEFEEVFPNPRHFRNAIVVDVDDVPDAGAAWLDAGLPTPSFVVWSSATNCHLIWLLKQWVDDRNKRSHLWFRTIQRAYTEACRGDRAYSNASHHNPLHSRFVTVVGPRDDYTLHELAQGVDLQCIAPVWASTLVQEVEIGPNCDVFNRSRRRVYCAVESYRERRDRRGFRELVQTIVAGEANAYEQRHARHVRRVHVKSVAKSVDSWSWSCYKRGPKPAEVRKARYKRSRHQYLSQIAEKRLQARKRRNAGVTLRQIASELAVSKSTVCNYLAATGARCPRSTTSEIAPTRVDARPILSRTRVATANFAADRQQRVPLVLDRRGAYQGDLSGSALNLCAVMTLRSRPAGLSWRSSSKLSSGPCCQSCGRPRTLFRAARSDGRRDECWFQPAPPAPEVRSIVGSIVRFCWNRYRNAKSARRYAEPRPAYLAATEARRRRAAEMRAVGLTTAVIAREIDVSRRVVQLWSKLSRMHACTKS